MLRITTKETRRNIRFLLEGKLGGPWVSELEQLFDAKKAEPDDKKIILDLTGLTGTDEAGRYLLALIQVKGGIVENSPLSASLTSRTSCTLPAGIKALLGSLVS